MNNDFDLIVIGGGPAGFTAAIEAAKNHLSVALLEKDLLGGVYLHEGCISVKCLAASEKRYRELLRGIDFGVYSEAVHIHTGEWMNRQRQVSSKMHLDWVETALQYPRLKVIYGNAQFMEQRSLKVVTATETLTFTAKNYIIATGSHPAVLTKSMIDGDKVGTSTHYVHRPQVPESLTILGGGYNGCEFAGIYATLGSQVTLVESRDRLLPHMDRDAGEFLARKYLARGIEVVLGDGAQSVGVSSKGDCEIILYSGRLISSTNVLMAVGRLPNVDGLGLTEAGIQYDQSILVDETLQTTAEGIYAIGDVNGLNPLAHSAIAQARAVIQKIIHEPEPVDFRQIPFCVYTDPEITCVGHTLDSAKKAGFEACETLVPFRTISRAIAQGEADGFLKLVHDCKMDRILGGLIIGREATELIAFLSFALQMKATARHLLNTVIPHPSYSEIFQIAAQRILEKGQK